MDPCRIKLSLIAGDDTGDTKFVLFGRTAQRIIGRPVEMLIQNNPAGIEFIPKEITDLLEKEFTWNVAFTENTLSSSTVSFQVNLIVRGPDNPCSSALQSPSASQASSAVPSQALSPGLSHGLSIGQCSAAADPSIGFADPIAGIDSPLAASIKHKKPETEYQSKPPAELPQEEAEVIEQA